MNNSFIGLSELVLVSRRLDADEYRTEEAKPMQISGWVAFRKEQ